MTFCGRQLYRLLNSTLLGFRCSKRPQALRVGQKVQFPANLEPSLALAELLPRRGEGG